MNTEITRNNPQSWFNLLWECIDFYRDSGDSNDETLDDLATAMAWVAEELNKVGDYVIDDQP